MTDHVSELHPLRAAAEFRAPKVVTLRDIFAVLWPRWPILALGSAVGLILAVVYLLLTPPKYEVTLTVAPVRTSQSLDDEQSSMFNPGALLGKSQPTKFDIYIGALQSIQLADVVERKYHVLKSIYPERWDEEHHRWLPPHRGPMSWVRWALGWPPRPEAPSTYDLAQYIKKTVQIPQPDDAGNVTLTLNHNDPAFARLLLSAMDLEADEMLRAHTLQQAEGYVTYISAQLEQASSAETRSTLVQLLLEQQKAKMLASSDLRYAAWDFDGPTSTPYPKKPIIPIILLLGIILGFMASFAVIVVRHYRDASRSNTQFDPAFAPQQR